MDMNQYLSMFIDESNDHLQSLNEKMLELKATRTISASSRLFSGRRIP